MGAPMMGGAETVTIMVADPVDLSLVHQLIDVRRGTKTDISGDRATVAFSSPTAALTCAVEIQQAMAAQHHTGGVGRDARIGISIGEAERSHDTYRGECVTEATGLCATAGAGQILLSDLVRAVTRTHAGDLVPIGELTVPGLSEAVVAWELPWQLPATATATATWPSRARLTREASPAQFGFVGRERELASLAQAVKEADAGQQRVVVLSGEPGIGKTTLIREVARGAQDRGAIVLYGGCDEDVRLPYQPFAEAFGHLVTHAPVDLLESHVAKHGDELARLVPVLATRVRIAEQVAPVDPESERYLLFASVAALLDRTCEDGLVVLVLDDMHWADKPSWALLRHLLTARSDRRLLALCAFRSTDIGVGRTALEVLADLHRVTGVSRIKLDGLATSDIAAMVSAATDERDTEAVEFAAALRDETNGNPFFTIEVLRNLAESGDLRAAAFGDGRWAQPGSRPLPLSVREVIGHRVNRLGDEARSVLSRAAVIGREFDFAVLQRLTGLEEGDLLTLLERAINAGVLEEVAGAADRFGFAHVLIRRCLYDELTEARRVRAHRHIAETLEALWGDNPGARIREFAHHFAAAGSTVDASKAVGYARRAGDAALASLAPAEAELWYETALRLSAKLPGADSELRAELLIASGEAQRQAGNPTFRETLLEAAALAQASHDTDRLVRAALANNRGRFGRVGAVDAARVEMLEAALAATSGDSPQRARLLATMAIELTFSPNWQRRHEIAEEARAMARRLADPSTTVAVHNRTYDTVAPSTALDVRRAEAAEAISLARDLADPVDQFFACYYGIRASIESGELAPADGYLAECIQIADSLGQPYLLWWTAFLRSWRALLAGRVEEAETHATRSLQIGTSSGQPEATLMFAALVAEIRRFEGRVEEIPELVTPAFEDFASDVPLVRALLAQTFCEVGDDERARQLLFTDGDDGFAGLPVDYQWVETATGYAEVCARLGETTFAPPLYELLAPWHRCIPCTGGAQTRGAVSLYLGMLAVLLGRHDAADGHLREAVELHQRLEAPFWTARSQLEWAKALLARAAPGDLARARSLLIEARDLAEHHGCAALARDADTLLRASGAGPDG